MNRFVRIDRRYNNPYRLTPYARLVLLKWGALLVVWVLLVSANAWLGVIAIIALIYYAIHRYRINHIRAAVVAPGYAQVAPAYPPPARQRFNPAPGWPAPPAGWVPDPGWRPQQSWPAAPPGWQFWIRDDLAPVGQRNTRSIPQDVKIAVAARDGGRCRQCGSSQELHFDHVIAWSKGGSNTVANIQLLCGPCNRRKGADDIPVTF
ncbi:MAG TPA: HNH endonuclease signature motif containing protein [Streptosporangiaceae bacterium]|nr:HNH endonuclease signature motif containing protein [Streptosporangiaceae bacterium]